MVNQSKIRCHLIHAPYFIVVKLLDCYYHCPFQFSRLSARRSVNFYPFCHRPLSAKQSVLVHILCHITYHVSLRCSRTSHSKPRSKPRLFHTVIVKQPVSRQGKPGGNLNGKVVSCDAVYVYFAVTGGSRMLFYR